MQFFISNSYAWLVELLMKPRRDCGPMHSPPAQDQPRRHRAELHMSAALLSEAPWVSRALSSAALGPHNRHLHRPSPGPRTPAAVLAPRRHRPPNTFARRSARTRLGPVLLHSRQPPLPSVFNAFLKFSAVCVLLFCGRKARPLSPHVPLRTWK